MVMRKGQEERNSGCAMGTCGVKGFGGQDSFCIRCLEHTNPQRQKKKSVVAMEERRMDITINVPSAFFGGDRNVLIVAGVAQTCRHIKAIGLYC